MKRLDTCDSIRQKPSGLAWNVIFCHHSDLMKQREETYRISASFDVQITYRLALVAWVSITATPQGCR